MGIEAYAEMAKISLSETEARELSAEMNRLVASFGALAHIRTEGVDVQVTVLDMNNVFRDDVVVKTVSRETLLANAPEQYDGYFQVPKTLD